MGLVLLPAGAWAATLEVTIQGVRTDRGTIRVGVCRKSEFLSSHCAYHAVVAAHQGTMDVTIRGIAPGQYAVAVFQDLYGSGKLKRNFFGMPEEDLGFSRDPSLRFGPPAFARCALTIGQGGGEAGGQVTVTLRHFGPAKP
ncbi:DUF2141 domain-containing protein [Lichenicoccus sp.]|uniref:DUF2141 domain-containing protein n=1 Tax=Lichenicoccus sp. TaxID=2781899 RepID=UPI003D0BBB1F